MITITYDQRYNVFLIEAKGEEVLYISDMPEKRWRKHSRVWAAPALRKNIEWMRKHLSNVDMYSKEALEVYNRPLVEPKAMEEFPKWYDFKNKPLPFQLEDLNRAYPMDCYGFFYEQGLGKTFTSLNLCAAWMTEGEIDSVLVICPSSIKVVWPDELAEHCPVEYEAMVLQAGKYKQVDKFIEKKEGFQWLIASIEGLSQGSAFRYLKRFASTRRCAVILDESSRIKNNGKIRTERCIKLSEIATKSVILSGTSITTGIENLYTQMKFLNPDILGFSSYYTFRAHYCNLINIEVKPNVHITKVIGYKNVDEFVTTVAPYVRRVEKTDVQHQLQGYESQKNFMFRTVNMNPTQKKLYKQLEEEFGFDLLDQDYQTSSVLEQRLRLLQVSGGFYPHDNGKTIEPKPIPGRNPKVDELLQLLEEISGKVIVWFLFRSELALVKEKLGDEALEFHGGCDDVEKAYAYREFRYGKARILLATRAAAYGLTLTSSSDSIYFSQDYSLEVYSQSQDRTDRIGQTEICNYTHLQCEKSIDQKIYKRLVENQKKADGIYAQLK